MRKIKKIVDLSWEFTAETPIYPGDPEPSVTVATTLENEGSDLSRNRRKGASVGGRPF